MGRIATVVLGVVTLGLALVVGFVWSFRTKYRPVQDRVRRFNRDVTNRRVLQRAGGVGAREAVVHHVGRTTGAAYRTPVSPVVVDDGFVVGLPYGPTADWVRNVLAAGAATVEFEGRRRPVTQPALVPVDEAAGWFGEADRRVQRLFGMDEVLVLRDAGTVAETTAAEPGGSGADSVPGGGSPQDVVD